MVFERVATLPVSVQTASAWHERPGAFERLTPPWERVEVVLAPPRSPGLPAPPPPPHPGSRVHLRIQIAPGIALPWIAEHRDFIPNELFRDVQIKGPFAQWDHRHMFRALTDSSSELRDRIEFRPPLGVVGRALATAQIMSKLDRMFAYRHATTIGDLAMHARWAAHPRRRVLVSGASGVLGKPLCAMLTTGGHTVIPLVRAPRKASENEVAWDPSTLQGSGDPGGIDMNALERARVDAVVHLAGENVASGRWTPDFKRRFHDSRIRGTRLLVDALSRLSLPPTVFVCASGTGYYGDRDDEALDESSAPGHGFLSDVTTAWEREASLAQSRGIRTCLLRIGPALTPKGGMLKSLLLSYQFGMGGKLGTGEQFIPWIGIDDCLAALHEAMMNPALKGAINVVSPRPVRQLEFAKVLGRVLSRPLLGGTVSTIAARAMGEMARECLFASANIRSLALTHAGFEFRHPELETCLRHVLGR